MRGFIILLSILLAVLGLGFTAINAYADADLDQFLDDVHSLGWYGTTAGDGDLIRNGYIVCGLVQGGSTLSAVARHVYINTDFDVSYTDAAQFVAVSVVNLCPEQAEGAIA